MLWEVEIRPAEGQVDREAERVLGESRELGAESIRDVRTARSFLIQGETGWEKIDRVAGDLLADPVVEEYAVRDLSSAPSLGAAAKPQAAAKREVNLNVLFKPGVTDNVAASTRDALKDYGVRPEAVATCRKYWINADADERDVERVASRVLANRAIEQVVRGPLEMESLAVGGEYEFKLVTVPVRGMSDEELAELSRSGQLFLSRVEMQTVRDHFAEQGRDPTDAELETIAQTWSEHCSHKTLTGRIRYRDEEREIEFRNMLKETIFAATQTIRERLGEDDWCVSVFRDNAGIVRFDEEHCVAMKVETHNHPSAIEPYGGANTGLGGVIRDPLGTGLGGRPVCNTDVFCFAPPEVPYSALPPGTLHPRVVAKGVVAGVRDYGNRMGIPTVNGAVYFDERYLGNPLVYCGNVAMMPADKCEKNQQAGDLIVVVGGRTGRDGIHGATFSSAELTDESESLSGGAVQIGDAITEKKLVDVILQARDRGLYSSITDCGAGGFSSAVGEMGADIGAEVRLERAPLKYSGLSYTEIWISEAQERMVLAVPPENWDAFRALCESEGVEATVIGEFQATGRLVLKYDGRQVADLSMEFLHNGRPPVVREAVCEPPKAHGPRPVGSGTSNIERKYDDDLQAVLGSLNVCSKEWIIRQYDHEVQAGSVVKPLVGAQEDGPSDAAVVRPLLRSQRGLVIACGMNPRYGDLDAYWMAASAIDEAVRNCVAVGADPRRIAILDNFCWGNTEKPEVLGSLVRAALACRDVAVAYGTPFISGKDSLNNEFSYVDSEGERRTVTIPPSLLISALGQIEDVSRAVTMDLKEPGNLIYVVGATRDELGGSHYGLVNGLQGGAVPKVDTETAPGIFAAVHEAIRRGLVRSCHDLSEGGLAVAAAEMAFSGGVGVELDLKPLSETSGIDDEAVLLFSESNTRFLLEVPAAAQGDVQELFARRVPDRKAHRPRPVGPAGAQPRGFGGAGGALCLLGRTSETGTVRIMGTKDGVVIDSPCDALKQVWKQPLAWD